MSDERTSRGEAAGIQTSRPEAAGHRLAASSSPYLRSHAKNPVAWYPWGPEALDRARTEDKPVFVSIGYAACHWCHVMERESFEDEAVAAFLNEHFVSIKVDREERPDVDQLYMAATIAMTGGGGWPMTVFITPDGRPFFAGTYFPRDARFGKPGFLDLCAKIRAVWTDRREDLETQATALVTAVREDGALGRPTTIGRDAEDAAVRSILKTFDETWGGFGGAPKFPAPFALSLLCRRATAHGDADAREAATVTLDRMARGGIHDHVGGGFARYSTDRYWHVPHFEKMLYDNAQLARVYAEASVALGEPAFERVARDTLDYLAREMTHPEGGLFSATDADSEGVEGKFFVWTKSEFVEVVGEADAAFVADALDVTDAGNWEGHNVLWQKEPLAVTATAHGLTEVDARAKLDAAKLRLREARATRAAPLTDDKILAAWNGLAISAFAVAGSIFDEPRYLEAARRAARFVTTSMRRPDRRIARSHGSPDIPGFLEDHAFVSEGLIELFEATGEGVWLDLAVELAEQALADFRTEEGPFANTGPAHDALAVRMLDGTDGATANPSAVFARVLVRLYAHTGRDALREAAEAAVVPFGAAVVRAPRAFLTTLDVVSRLTSGAPEVVLVGARTDENFAALDRALARCGRGTAAIVRATDPSTAAHHLVAGRAPTAGTTRAFVCRDFACEAPVTTADALTTLLSASREPARAHVGRARLEGRATREGTQALATARRALADRAVSPAGLALGSFLVDDAAGTVAAAIAAGVNLLVADAPRAEALGEAVRRAVAAGTPRSSLVLAVLLQGASKDVLTGFEARAGVAVDLALLPAEPHTIDLCFETRASIDGLAVPVGLYLKAPLGADALERVLASTQLGALACLAAPLSALEEGALDAPAALERAGVPFLALRTLQWDRAPHVANFAEQIEPELEVADVTPSLDVLRAVEVRYQKTIAPHLTASGSTDPRDLLRFSEDLRKAEQVLDDLGEVEAFVHQSIAGAVSAAFGALDLEGAIVTGDGGEPFDLGRAMRAIREDYLEALEACLRGLAAAVARRQRGFAEEASALVGVAPRALASTLLERAATAPGVRVAIFTARKPDELEGLLTWISSPPRPG